VLLQQAYAPDTVVVDVEEPPAVARPRTTTEDLTMQVHHSDGSWHRRAAVGGGHRFTGCGEQTAVGSPIRHEEYGGPLCQKGCFTAFELELGRKADKEARDRIENWQPSPIFRRKDTDR
jgi:hypothetical protein